MEFVSAGSKVLSDKVYDTISYIFSFGYSAVQEGQEDKEDTLEDYQEVINPENYTEEESNKRLFPKIDVYNEYKHFFGEPTHIIDNIYLGSAFNAASFNTLKDNDIKVIINVTKEISQYYPEEFIYSQYNLYDNNQNTIKQYLEDAYNDILKYQDEEDGNILIHCFMGASRSATIVLYYLIKNKGYKFDEALKILRDKRPLVNPTFRLAKDVCESLKE